MSHLLSIPRPRDKPTSFATLDSGNANNLNQRNLLAISTQKSGRHTKGTHDGAGALRDLNTLAVCLATGQSADEKFAVTLLADHTGMSFLIAKKGVITVADKEAAQKLHDLLLDPDNQKNTCHSIAKDVLFPFISARCYTEINTRLAELHSAIVNFELDRAIEMYQGGRFGNIYKEFPNCVNYVSHRDYDFALKSRPTVRELLHFLFSDIEQFTLPSYMNFPSPPSESSEPSSEPIPNSSKRLDDKFHQLAAAAKILLSSKFFAYHTSDFGPQSYPSTSTLEKKIHRQARELVRRLEGIQQYMYDIRHLAHRARRSFPTGKVNIQWVDHPVESSSSDFGNIDPELQLVLHLHNSTYSSAFADPALKLPIGCSGRTSFYAAHWLSAYNSQFPDRAQWVVRASEETLCAERIVPRREHCTIYTKADPTFSVDFVDTVSTRVMKFIDPQHYQSAFPERNYSAESQVEEKGSMETEQISSAQEFRLKWYVHLNPAQESRSLGKRKAQNGMESKGSSKGIVWMGFLTRNSKKKGNARHSH